MSKQCEHFSQEKKGISPNTKSCEECQKEHLPVIPTLVLNLIATSTPKILNLIVHSL